MSIDQDKTKEDVALSPETTDEDKVLDLTLRPRTWDQYIGQEKIKNNVKVIIQAAKERKEAPEHILLYGPSGLGKTSLAHLIAKESQTGIRITSGPAIEKAGDLAAILTNLCEKDILFIDEIHRLNKLCEEIIYPAMEDYKLHLILGRGPMARTMEFDLPKFTIIGATTRLGAISAPLRNRFGAVFQLNFYSKEDIEKIIQQSAKILGISVEKEAGEHIAKCSRLTPRVANRLLKRVRDFSQIKGEKSITKDSAKKALNFLEVDELGLEAADRKILDSIINKFDGGPVGLQALAAATSEEEDTILDIYEPYLMQIGFIDRTPRGRTATNAAYKHLGLTNKNQNSLI
jgi:Holliday junction DNA helicase RuvB